MTLNELSIGRDAVITDIRCDRAVRRRLLDMGLTPHTRVLVRKVAPLGDPIEISLRGYELTLRRDEACCIFVREDTE